ncbi:MAG TPA: TetR family transcriptional regulator [Ktedonobacteraceae bacterium]|jgi:TetR/AcrR family acrAB operon transcriptional repressor|nr:TetR family transcriptional regulator [Ktedonobacteraceae bacterium]
MRRTKEEAAITRQNLLEAAFECFRSKGYTETTLDDIAERAGTTRGAIAWHFGNKAELFNTLVRERYERAASIFREAAASSGGSPLQQLRELLILWLTYAEEHPDFRAMLELIQLKTELSPELSEGMQEKVERQRFTIDYFASLIRRGIKAGELRADVDPEIAAQTALGMVNGITNSWLIDQNSFSLKRIAAQAVDLLLLGMANK